MTFPHLYLFHRVLGVLQGTVSGGFDEDFGIHRQKHWCIVGRPSMECSYFQPVRFCLLVHHTLLLAIPQLLKNPFVFPRLINLYIPFYYPH
jgi:hypothetical protein